MSQTAESRKVPQVHAKRQYRLEKVEIPYEITYEDGTLHHFIVRKANGMAIKTFRNVILGGAKIKDDKIIGFGNMADAEPTLVAACMTEILLDPSTGNRRGTAPVDVHTVLSWDYKLIKDIHEDIKKISDMKDFEGVDTSPQEKVKRLERELLEAKQQLAEHLENEAVRKNS